MTKARKQPTRQRQSTASASYLALASAYPIHPIRSDADLDDAIAMIDALLSRAESLDDQEQDYLESLGHEIERYEAAAYPMPVLTEADLLRQLMDARDATLSDVAATSGIAISTLSAILHGKRKLNLTHVHRLANYFGIHAAVFLEK
jgi:HTH-type transcriptional regulator / antitoxin HigA